MFHRLRAVYPLPDLKLCAVFREGVTKIYDVKPLLEKWEVFKELKDEDLFDSVHVDLGGYGIIWNDRIDLSSDSIWEKGETVKTPFDNLMAFSDATTLWGLHESTLRKAVVYGKLVGGVDVCKFGKQWVVTTEAMYREYGEPLKDSMVVKLKSDL
mgnify:FL=1